MDTTPLSLLDFERLARERLPQLAWDYYASGAGDEITLRGSRAAFERMALHYRVLVDVSGRETATELLGHRLSLPVMIAPTAFHCMACGDGELATARAAEGAGTIMVLSSLSNTDMEDVVKATRAPVFFQLYVYRDRAVTADLVARAEAAGCRALVLTVDAPLLGCRERDVRNRFQLPAGLSVRNLVPAGYGSLVDDGRDSGLAAYFASLIDASLSWKDLEWLRSRTRLPILLKGVIRADDAQRAVEAGVAAVVVSNHGGRQLDTSPATIDVLPAVVDAVGARIPVLLDSGVRRGTDVIKALALGARAVLVGRPILWGLAVAGQAGALEVLEILRRELDLAMALCGCAALGAISRDLVEPGAR